jgi:hypothetical protein
MTAGSVVSRYLPSLAILAQIAGEIGAAGQMFGPLEQMFGAN